MTLPADDVAWIEVIDVGPDIYDLAHELVANCHGNSNRLLCPLVPLVNMNIRATDARVVDANQHIIDANDRFRNLFQPKPTLRFALNQRLHYFPPRKTRCTLPRVSDMRFCFS